VPPIQKVVLPWHSGRRGGVYAHFRLPPAGVGPFPAVVILQGNDTVKETMVLLEDLALGRGMATLNIDPPGWGESALSGNVCSTPQDWRECSRLAVDLLQQQPQVHGEAIGVLGFSAGGLWAAYCAGLEPRFAAVLAFGAPYLSVRDMGAMLKNAMAVQARQALRHCGARTIEEVQPMMEGFAIDRTLAQVRAPVLIVQGEKDEFEPTHNAEALAKAVGGPSTVRIIAKGDHMCTHVLGHGLADEIADWLAGRLQMRAA